MMEPITEREKLLQDSLRSSHRRLEVKAKEADSNNSLLAMHVLYSGRLQKKLHGNAVCLTAPEMVESARIAKEDKVAKDVAAAARKAAREAEGPQRKAWKEAEQEG